MEKNYVISNVKIFKPSGEVVTSNIFVSGDKISKISADEPENLKIIDGKGKFATPGLVNARCSAVIPTIKPLWTG